MIIRDQQMKTLQVSAEKSFEDRAARYLQEMFPRNCAAIGDDSLRSIVRFGRKRANIYKFPAERSIVMYLHIMFMLGSYFDSDPLLIWAAKILNNEDLKYERMRINSLWQKAYEFVFITSGADNEHIYRALLKIREYPFLTSSGSLDSNFNEHVLQLLKDLNPEKFSYLGQPVFIRLLEAGKDKAAQYGITGSIGLRMIIVFMFILGSDFDKDPLHDWAGAILRDKSIDNQERKLTLLHGQALKYLSFYLPPEAAGSPASEKSWEV